MSSSGDTTVLVTSLAPPPATSGAYSCSDCGDRAATALRAASYAVKYKTVPGTCIRSVGCSPLQSDRTPSRVFTTSNGVTNSVVIAAPEQADSVVSKAVRLFDGPGSLEFPADPTPPAVTTPSCCSCRTASMPAGVEGGHGGRFCRRPGQGLPFRCSKSTFRARTPPNTARGTKGATSSLGEGKSGIRVGWKPATHHTRVDRRRERTS
eukprot:scaffold24947_cov73-Phaeocystis_antarctica.AAC.8